MLITYCLGWWYGRGWKWRLKRGTKSLTYWADYFSAGKLVGTLFSPYRQISAQGGGGTIMQRIADNLVSRAVGFFVRLFMLLLAGVVLLGIIIYTGILVVLWPVIPFIPLIAIVLAVTGVAL